jgi:tetratricopeptide (TPR) repeat protein
MSAPDQARLAQGLHDHPDWLSQGWRYLADYYASRGDFYMASQTALRFLPPPTIPGVPAEKPLPLLEAHFEQHNDDLVEGLMLAQAELRAEHPDRALALLNRLEQMPRTPSAVFYLKGQVYVQQKDWEKAWNAFARARDSL